MLRPVYLFFPTRYIYKPLRCNATLIIRYFHLITECLLSFSYRHSFRYTDVDMDLLSGGILYAQYLIFPVRAIILIQLQSTLYSHINHILIINIHTGHKRECFGYDVCLSTMVVFERRIVRTYIRKIIFFLLIAISDIGHHLLEPHSRQQCVKLFRGHSLSITAVIPFGVTRVLSVYCNFANHPITSFSKIISFSTLRAMLPACCTNCCGSLPISSSSIVNTK